MEYCKPPYKYGDKGGWCDCSFKDIPNAPGCFRPECWDRIKFYYDCNTRPDCPDRVIVIEICDTNASRDDNIKVTLNGVVIASELDFSKDEKNGYFLIADPSATLEASESSIPLCHGSTPNDPISVIRFDPNAIVGGVNTLNVKIVKQNYNGNAGSFIIRTYCNNNGKLINGCDIAIISYGSEGDFTFTYDSCCGNCPGGTCPPCPTPTHTPTPTPTPTITHLPPTSTVPTPNVTPTLDMTEHLCNIKTFIYNKSCLVGGSSLCDIESLIISGIDPAEQTIRVDYRTGWDVDIPVGSGTGSCSNWKLLILPEGGGSPYPITQPKNPTFDPNAIFTQNDGVEPPNQPYSYGYGTFCKPAGVTKVQIKLIYSAGVPPAGGFDSIIQDCVWSINVYCNGDLCAIPLFKTSNFLSFNNFDFDQNINQNNQKISSLGLSPTCSTYCGGGPANENLCLKISNYVGSKPDSPYKVEGVYPITINPSICYNYTGNWANDCLKPSTINIETIDVTGNGGAIYMSHKTKINGVCVDLTLTSSAGSVGSLCGSGTLSSGSGVAKINDVADGSTFNWEITTESCITPTPTPTYAPGCHIDFQIATRGCCIEYLSNEILRAVGDGEIYLYNINQNPSKCCKKFTVRVNGGLIYKYGEYFYKNVKDGDILLVQAYNECKCKPVPVPANAIAPAYKKPIGYNAAECPSHPAVRAVKDSITDKLKIILNKNFFRR